MPLMHVSFDELAIAVSIYQHLTSADGPARDHASGDSMLGLHGPQGSGVRWYFVVRGFTTWFCHGRPGWW